jgi:hypothetical protein
VNDRTEKEDPEYAASKIDMQQASRASPNSDIVLPKRVTLRTEQLEP